MKTDLSINSKAIIMNRMGFRWTLPFEEYHMHFVNRVRLHIGGNAMVLNDKCI